METRSVKVFERDRATSSSHLSPCGPCPYAALTCLTPHASCLPAGRTSTIYFVSFFGIAPESNLRCKEPRAPNRRVGPIVRYELQPSGRPRCTHPRLPKTMCYTWRLMHGCWGLARRPKLEDNKYKVQEVSRHLSVPFQISPCFSRLH